MRNATDNFKITEGKRINLKDYDSALIPNWALEKDKEGKRTVKKQAVAILTTNKQKLAAMQELFWASDNYSLLIILQGMDAAGKDGVIRHVMS